MHTLLFSTEREMSERNHFLQPSKKEHWVLWVASIQVGVKLMALMKCKWKILCKKHCIMFPDVFNFLSTSKNKMNF